ncbi:lysine exporter LysO family protein [Geosporobacter ferrireducens]|uniref:Lysine exporter LysO family protein n=1 Tax=Geosporobacter ferrireducens TaxID=1424294 RepID=A0A1D8GPZ2_9FIRM|nr:lysine exporter LysO family protein [Geosporobacter ferrireducens]AOT72864.1 hypothetical protein Gferi_26895 [Geosporobacter ferrireducens]MTI55269.1 lysine exporter LysO family protein [Geosporobacter ferrireducens]
MTVRIMLSVLLGVLFGLFFFPDQYLGLIGHIIDIGLCALLFFVGIDIGRNKDIIPKIMANGIKIFLVPLMIALGSIIGSIAGGFLLGIPFYEAGAIGAGFGWYSLSAIELSKYSAETGALAFITNISREVIALISIPFIAKYIGKLESIAPAGATAMDTSLPVISNATNGNTAVISFITGLTLSALVPVLVPLLISLH